jgi:hypothetical protein
MNDKKTEIIEVLEEEAVFLITALSLTGFFFAHYVGITVYSIWLNQIPIRWVYHCIWYCNLSLC